jgi:tRNA uridine 5-carbamoylmethylation protein Kti12
LYATQAPQGPYHRAVAAPVLILTGPPGAGKTTTARILAGRHSRAVHLESDLFFHAIRSGYVEPWKPASRDQNEVVMGIVAGAAGGYAGAGYLTIVDGIVLPRFFLEPLRDALADAGHAVDYAVLRAPLATCVARAAERDEGPLGDSAVVERLWHDFAELGALERHAVDLGGEGPEEAADLVAAAVGEGRLRA